MSHKISFIINPISGNGKQKALIPYIRQYLNSQFKVDFLMTKAPKHATELAQKAALSSTAVIAVGGDGSVNEVAQGLLNSNVLMGIVPMGSGNGLARHLNIPLKLENAIALINKLEYKTIDAIKINNSLSMNVSGIGFDAFVADRFAKSGKRGFNTYIKETLKAYRHYKANLFKIETSQGIIESKALLVSLANSSQFGNNAYIAPNASVTDGLIDLVILSPFSVLQAPSVGIRLLQKQVDKSRFVQIIQTKKVTIESETNFHLHIDGEPMGEMKSIEAEIIPQAIKMICS
ncbi:MAG: diacylglycerol kinase family lipid kinase [Bacteroidales bacterium]|nr:diacylglycerol kinase family lipid kinase [Bacteroidales bacterium]